MTGFLSTKRAIFSWIVFLIAISLSTLSSGGDPDRIFFTIKTEHFNIHYEDGLDHTAQELAVIAEEIHSDLSVVFQWEVKKRTDVVLTDSTDSANGSASVIGKPVIRLYVTAPSVESSLQSHDHWLRALFVHEYAHIVHLSIRGHFPDFFNTIFGDVYLPNQMAPRWFIEGLAVLIETHQTTSGRIRSSQFQMFIRTAALEDTLLNLGQASNNPRQYLRGSHSYIYGAMFLKYIYQKFGMDKIVAFCHEYGKSVIPYGMNRIFREIFGQDVQELYSEWVAFEKKSAQKVKAALEKEGVTNSTALTSDGEDKGLPLFEAGSKSILLPIDNGMQDTAIYRLGLDGKKKSGVAYAGVSTQISEDRNGRLFYTRSAPYKNYYNFMDLFVLEGEDASPRRLTVGRRARYAAVSPRGDRVALSVNDAGTSKLTLTDEQGRLLDVLIDSPLDDQVFSPAWSPDGKQIAVVMRTGVQPDLVLLDAATKEITPITDDRFIESSPSFTADGRYIVFSSDRSGIPNIYAFDLTDRALLKITNVLSGAFFPAVSDDGKTLAFLKYSSTGYDLHVTPFDPKNAKVAEDIADPFEIPKPLPKLRTDLKPRSYNPFPSMIPSYWMLNVGLDAQWHASLQAVTAFSDVTGKHNLGADLLYRPDQQTVSGRVGYAYYGIGPSVHVGVSRQYMPQNAGYRFHGEDKKWLQVVTRGSLSLGIPIIDVDSGHSLSVGYDIVHSKPHNDEPMDLDPTGEIPDTPSQYFRSGVSFGWGYSDVTSSPMGIGPHKGRSLSAGIDLYHPLLGGNQKLATFTYRWSEYLPMPWHHYHVLAMSLSGGTNISSPPNQASFTVGGQTDINIVDTILNNRSNGVAALRGYPPDAFSGSRYHLLKLNYRFPIWFAEAAYGTIPLFLKNIQASVFSDNVLISYAEFNREDWRASVGAEIGWVFTIGYYQQIALRTGYAYGLMDQGIHEFILVVSGGI
jgi:hypothetical protein